MKLLTNLLMKFDKEYLSYINDLNFTNFDLKKYFLELLNELSYTKRKEIWNNKILKNRKFNDELYKLSNPFYIGFGNPKSKILFIGKEKGFDLNEHKDLLFEESINNIYHWEKIICDDLISKPNEINKLFNFSPLFPLSYNYKKPFRKSHSWYIYSKVLAASENNLSDYESYFNKSDYKSSLFHKCFITEFNYVPSKYSKGLGEGIDKRIKFLKNDFFNKFKVIVVGARTYLNGKRFNNNGDKIIEDTFNVSFSENIFNPRMKSKMFKSDNKIVILTSQLSGAAGWNNSDLLLMGQIIKENVS